MPIENLGVAFDNDQIWPLVDNLAHRAQADIYLILLDTDITYYSATRRKRIFAAGITSSFGGNKIALANFTKPTGDLKILLLHELGHARFFGLMHIPNDLERPERDVCATIKFIMCAWAQDNPKAVFDETHKQAWRDFYERR